MSKRITLLVLVAAFGLGAVVGLQTTSVQAGSCFYKCICSQAYKCCTTQYGTSCKLAPTAPIGCPQVAC